METANKKWGKMGGGVGVRASYALSTNESIKIEFLWKKKRKKAYKWLNVQYKKLIRTKIFKKNASETLLNSIVWKVESKCS